MHMFIDIWWMSHAGGHRSLFSPSHKSSHFTKGRFVHLVFIQWIYGLVHPSTIPPLTIPSTRCDEPNLKCLNQLDWSVWTQNIGCFKTLMLMWEASEYIHVKWSKAIDLPLTDLPTHVFFLYTYFVSWSTYTMWPSSTRFKSKLFAGDIKLL